jgi:hypothetical protein
MAMSITLADNADVTPYEGENIDANWTDSMRDEVGKQAEAYLCVLLKYDVVTNWASLPAVKKIILTEYVARTIAVAGIAYNMAGYTSRIEAEDLINIHLYRINEIKEILERASVKDFLGI